MPLYAGAHNPVAVSATCIPFTADVKLSAHPLAPYVLYRTDGATQVTHSSILNKRWESSVAFPFPVSFDGNNPMKIRFLSTCILSAAIVVAPITLQAEMVNTTQLLASEERSLQMELVETF